MKDHASDCRVVFGHCTCGASDLCFKHHPIAPGISQDVPHTVCHVPTKRSEDLDIYEESWE